MTEPTRESVASSSIGYGPRPRLYFDGDESRYELFEVKFLSFLRLQGLLEEFEKDVPDTVKNARIFAELIMVLDDKSLSLVMRDAKNDGKAAVDILRERWLCSVGRDVFSLEFVILSRVCIYKVFYLVL